MTTVSDLGFPTDRLRLWAGLECTINRVGDAWSNQATFSGHDERSLSDLSLFGSTGVDLIRYPVLWEAVAPDSLEDFDFALSDERMAWFRTADTKPIVGLLHHGSGPRYTSLVDPDFPEKLARYAGAVARRYPWAEWYTPVNEPLTTARFSGLYGVWYPHGKDDQTMARALYNEVKGTVLAMEAIREVNPDAKLLQTDDLGRAQGPIGTRSSVDFQNTRRWLGFDLSMGRVTPEHPLHDWLVEAGVGPEELGWLVEHSCPPDVLGINHYPLSNRLLDDDLQWYPEDVRVDQDGGYVDVPAVRSGRAQPVHVEEVLRDVWERYGDQPFAVTEVHIDGDSHTRMQWLWEVWVAATRIRDEGAPVVAVTVWSLLGTADWNTLCTTPAGGDTYYEPGVFDTSSGTPKPTPLTEMVRALAKTGRYEHPALERPGWWRSPGRFHYAVPVEQEQAS